MNPELCQKDTLQKCQIRQKVYMRTIIMHLEHKNCIHNKNLFKKPENVHCHKKQTGIIILKIFFSFDV